MVSPDWIPMTKVEREVVARQARGVTGSCPAAAFCKNDWRCSSVLVQFRTFSQLVASLEN